MTEKLYETDGMKFDFTATVLACRKTENGYAVVLDRTAFFPGGGGQACDVGTLGGVPVSGAALRDGDPVHYTTSPLTVGATVEGKVDRSVRFPRMQCHTAEHIVSGLVHARYGYENVGFHLGEGEVTMDFDGELTGEQLDEIEDLANAAVYADLPVTVSFPSPEKLPTLAYRSKLDLSENVRLVSVEGIDVCACCAPHVSKTGEIGLIRLLGFIRYKGGIRVRLVAGTWALADYRARCRTAQTVSELLSVPQEKIAEGVERTLAASDALAQNNAALRRRLAELLAGAATPTGGNRVFFLSGAESDPDVARHLAAIAVKSTDGIVAVCYGETERGFRYLLASEKVDLTRVLPEINRALIGRGGGKPGMAEGTFASPRGEIERFFGAE